MAKNRICDVCGGVDKLPRTVHEPGPDDAIPPVNDVMIEAVIGRSDLTNEEKAEIVRDLNDNTLMLQHVPVEHARWVIENNPDVENSEELLSELDSFVAAGGCVPFDGERIIVPHPEA